MRRRRRRPLFVVSDGALAIIRMIEECFARPVRRCRLVGQMRDMAAKIAIDPWPESDKRVSARLQARSRANYRPAREPPTRISY